MTIEISKKRHQITFLSVLTATILVSGAFTAMPSAYSQTIVFQDDYTTNAGWTQIGTRVTVDASSFPDIVKFNAVADGSDKRVYKSINSTLSDTEWTLESEFLANTHSGSPSHNVFAVTAGSGDPAVANQDAIIISYTNTGDTGIGLQVRTKDGSGALSFHGTKVIVGTNEQVYLRLARTSDTTATFEVFSDSARTQHLSGSPVSITDIPTTITDLDTIQHANSSTGGSGRNLTAEIDNTTIFEDEGTTTCNGLTATIVGTTGDDILNGTAGVDVIVGLGGNDYIVGKGGDDTICGGDGVDTIRGSSGQDTIFGEDGDDLIAGDSGDDILSGGDGNDTLLGGSGDDDLEGNADNDTLVGNSGDDDLDGSTGTDICDVSDDEDNTVTSCETELQTT